VSYRAVVEWFVVHGVPVVPLDPNALLPVVLWEGSGPGGGFGGSCQREQKVKPESRRRTPVGPSHLPLSLHLCFSGLLCLVDSIFNRFNGFGACARSCDCRGWHAPEKLHTIGAARRVGMSAG